MIFQLRFQAILMFWLMDVFYVIAGIEADNHHLLESIASCATKRLPN